MLLQTSYQHTLRFDEQNLFPKMLSQHAGTFWEASWHYTSPVEVIRVRVTAKEFNDAEKVRTARRALLILLPSTIRETAHVSRNSPPFPVSFTRLVDVRLPAGNDSLRRSKGHLGPVSGADGAVAGPASSARAGLARTRESRTPLVSWH